MKTSSKNHFYATVSRQLVGILMAGLFVAPSAAMGHPPAPVARTGQTTSSAPGDDGDLQKGVPWPTPQFIDNRDGSVTDNLTGLVWLKNANCFGGNNWPDALSAVSDLNNRIAPPDNTGKPNCGYSGGKIDWRLPNIKELLSLLDYEFFQPALSNAKGTGKWTEGDAFSNVGAFNAYWSSTVQPGSGETQAYIVGFDIANVNPSPFTVNEWLVWPARGGK